MITVVVIYNQYMKKILSIFLITIFLFSNPISGYIYAEEEVTTTTEEETTSDEEVTTLSDTLETTEEDTTSSISIWTILLSVLGISLFIAVIYYMLKNFNIGSGK